MPDFDPIEAAQGYPSLKEDGSEFGEADLRAINREVCPLACQLAEEADLSHYQAQYGADIEFVMGAGLNLANAADLVAYTGIQQVHGSFKTWYQDPTTQQGPVSFAYHSHGAYEGADLDLARALGQALGKKE